MKFASTAITRAAARPPITVPRFPRVQMRPASTNPGPQGGQDATPDKNRSLK
jgi:hypothetical protein